MADYRVVTEGDNTFVGTLNEDFAIESQSGNVFQLGNVSWRILYVRGGEVTVRDAHGAPATVPFWLGEAPGRTTELSSEFSELREQIWEQGKQSVDGAVAWLQHETGADEWAARQAVTYVESEGAAIGVVPSQRRVVFERFFDESGGMQIVIHAPFGARINRAWGLAIRKCFCRTFDFELQASADDNGIVLAVGPQQSFPLEQMFTLLDSTIARDVLIQALLAAPMFGVRWRWNVTRALAVLRQRGGKKVPPYLQKFRAEDLLTAVFPMQTACFEHRTGDLEPPDHPLVHQTVDDCLHEVMDLDGLQEILRDIEAGHIEMVARDTREPSPFSHQLVNANVYSFLDDAPLEERRARAVPTRRSFRADDVRDLGRLDPEAIAQVRREAWPIVRDAEELHDVLLLAGALPESEGSDWRHVFEKLAEQSRATRCKVIGGPVHWVAVERWPAVNAALTLADQTLPPSLPESMRSEIAVEDARLSLVRGRLEICGPVTAARIASDLGMDLTGVQIALEQLELAGFLLRGHFTNETQEMEWCERRLLARIHRLTLDGLRRQVAPVDAAGYMRFLLSHHQISSNSRPTGIGALQHAVAALEGFEAPAGAWEHDLLPSRLDYENEWLDKLFTSGQVTWGRIDPPAVNDDSRGQVLSRVSPIGVVRRTDLAWLLPPERKATIGAARWDAQAVYEALTTHGALFFNDLLAVSNLLPSQLEDALRELAALGMATSDGFTAVRMIAAKGKREGGLRSRRKTRRHRDGGYSKSGRWSKFPPFVQPIESTERAEKWAWLLLKRYGVMFRDVLSRESLAPSWRELASVYRRLEMRGEIRGGRFVAGVAGEQFALPEAVEQLRKQRDEPDVEQWAVISAVDPLNLVGVITTAVRVPALRSNRIAFLNGRAIASREGREIRSLADVDDATRQRAEGLLTAPGSLRRDATQARELSTTFDVDALVEMLP